MVLTSANAAALALIILTDVQGAAQVRKQLPLDVSDAGAQWLVTGKFYEVPSLNVHFCVTHVFIAKSDAEVVGIGSDLRTKLDAASEARWRKELSEEHFNQAFGPPTVFAPGGPQLELYDVTKGGLINSTNAARDYGYTLMKGDVAASMISKEALEVAEQAGVWHVKAVDRDGRSTETLSFSRTNGKVLSFINR